MKEHESAQQRIFEDENIRFRERLSFDSGRYGVVVTEKPDHMFTMRIDWLRPSELFVVRHLRK